MDEGDGRGERMEGIFKKVLNFPSPFPPPRRMDEKVLTLYFIRGYLMSFRRYGECHVVPRFHSRVLATRRRVARCIPLPSRNYAGQRY